jgi:transcriptional regulator of acetoin/glycerol metabolism
MPKGDRLNPHEAAQARQAGITPLAEMKLYAAKRALHYTRGNYRMAARLLGISRSSIYRILGGRPE